MAMATAEISDIFFPALHRQSYNIAELVEALPIARLCVVNHAKQCLKSEDQLPEIDKLDSIFHLFDVSEISSNYRVEQWRLWIIIA